MASISIRQGTPADASSIADVHYRAQEKYHGFYGAFFVNSPREILTRATGFAVRRRENVYLVAVDDADGRVVGFVRYAVKGEEVKGTTAEEGEGVERDEDEEEDEEKVGPSLFAVKEHLKALWEEFDGKQGAMDECYEKAANGRRHIYINHLMIDPAYQRKGIGRQLLAAVLERSDEEGIPAFLMSSAESRGLYGQMGFGILGTWRVDNGAWAGRIVEVERRMGMDGDEGLVEEYEGVGEVEDVMVRWAR
ncbi:acyl-CoA N-acyltransferase [Trichoderma citrinoviride]|uniref:Acyl-CoA N-acyltransferase n=1 Tax=Trichoderma citrinoviride TaxID=58853 RepID=A0A2T4B264_9HYPO|nr:acyl-CoA N-acyltransferase [Trichoderma citrinoviride]PTB63404.1 acyl-CoA N-acyltransferase [Trichoderma citrinoviride]